MASYTFTLKPTPPFRLDLTVWVLRRRPDNQIDRWDGQAYRRILVLNDAPLAVTVTQIGPPETPLLEVSLLGAKADANIEAPVTACLERLLGINIDLEPFYQFSEQHPKIQTLVSQFRGAKPPRLLTLFETLLNAIACQQLSLTVGITLLNRLSQAFGLPFKSDSVSQIKAHNGNAFPRPQDIITADPEELRKIGFSYRKGNYMLNLSTSMFNGQIDLDAIDALDDKAAIKQLCQIYGVGRWTAEYFLLRGLGRTHVFPGDDVGARNNLQYWLDLPERMDYQGVHRVLAGWEEYGGLIYFHLLLSSLLEKEVITI